jgi:hypothetical protein
MSRIDSRYTYLSTVPLPSLEELEEEEISTAEAPVAKEDFLHFGREWPKISAELSTEDLFALIEARKKEILEQMETMHPIAQMEPLAFQEEVYALFETGSLKPSKLGGGGVYFLCDAIVTPHFVIKPADEAILCLNNSKHRASPYNDKDHRLREYLPLYQSPPTEAAVYLLASECGIASCTPETHLMVLSSPQFYDISDRFENGTRVIDREKLCSVQRFIPNSIDLNQAMHEWFEAGLEETQPLPIDQDDYEEVLLLLWLIFDGDGHSSNFRIYFKGLNENGEAYYGIKKIDNGLSLPESNCYLLNYLGYLANARKAPSQHLLEIIKNLDEDRCIAIMDYYRLSYAKEAFLERVEILKEITQRPSITLEEINLRFEILCLPNGKEHALSPKTVEEITAELTRTTSTRDDSIPNYRFLRA